MLESLLNLGRKIIPKKIFKAAQPVYHYLLALSGALVYRFPSRSLYLVLITGTKGKSTTAELVSHVLETAGKKTALANTIRIKIAKHSVPNPYKMTIKGRWFVQKFLRQAVNAGCTHAIVEMTSEGSKQFRHKFLAPNALIFTNLTPEHIESHGSYEKYVQAKLAIGRALEQSPKSNKILVVNSDSKEADKFLKLKVATKLIYGKEKIEDWMRILPGEFNAYNVLAAVTLARALKIDEATIRDAIKSFPGALGRMQKIAGAEALGIEVIVDYAHTPESLEQVYQTYEGKRRICVLGGTGGGRDKWKRPVMGGLASKYCDQIFLTDEDPYNEDPRQIVEEMLPGITDRSKVKIIMERREAMREAFKTARPGDVVLITGKGTDPYIMRENGNKEPWSDARIAAEELEKLGK
jgi:UDP-N-acetylmuramoyl-L-alanyl-D-glutamate--2,6-diaminopimelate ligase